MYRVTFSHMVVKARPRNGLWSIIYFMSYHIFGFLDCNVSATLIVTQLKTDNKKTLCFSTVSSYVLGTPWPQLHCPAALSLAIITLATPESRCVLNVERFMSRQWAEKEERSFFFFFVLFACNFFKELEDNLSPGCERRANLPASDWRQSAIQARGEARLWKSRR